MHGHMNVRKAKDNLRALFTTHALKFGNIFVFSSAILSTIKII
jgi:hypothetical protein